MTTEQVQDWINAAAYGLEALAQIATLTNSEPLKSNVDSLLRQKPILRRESQDSRELFPHVFEPAHAGQHGGNPDRDDTYEQPGGSRDDCPHLRPMGVK